MRGARGPPAGRAVSVPVAGRGRAAGGAPGQRPRPGEREPGAVRRRRLRRSPAPNFPRAARPAPPAPARSGTAHPAPGQAGSAPPAPLRAGPAEDAETAHIPAPPPAAVPLPARHGAAPLTCRRRRVPRAALGSGRRGRALPPLASNSLQGYGHYGAGRRVSRQLLLPRPRASQSGPAPRRRARRFSASHWRSVCVSSKGAGLMEGGPMAWRRGRGRWLARGLAPRRGAGPDA